MRKIFCDFCGKEIEEENTYEIEIEIYKSRAKRLEMCKVCGERLEKIAMTQQWGDATQSDENPEEVKKVKEKVKEESKPEAKKKRTVDYGKIMALKNAGWTGKQIAAEVHLSEAAVWAATKKSKEEGITGEGYLDEEE